MFYKKFENSHMLIVFYLFIWITFFINGISFLDPDFGWHLKMGQLILARGIPITDPFSYTMSSFPFVDHEWLTNIMIAKLYPTLGFLGLSAFYSTAAVLAIYIATSKYIFSKKYERLRV